MKHGGMSPTKQHSQVAEWYAKILAVENDLLYSLR